MTQHLHKRAEAFGFTLDCDGPGVGLTGTPSFYAEGRKLYCARGAHHPDAEAWLIETMAQQVALENSEEVEEVRVRMVAAVMLEEMSEALEKEKAPEDFN